jgi:hypothetical protein
MSNKLEFGISVEIVHTTLRDLFPQRDISIEHPVGEIVLSEADLEALRENLQRRLQAINVHLKMPRIEPRLTVKDLGRSISDWSGIPGAPTIAWSSLPGNDPEGPDTEHEELPKEHREKQERPEPKKQQYGDS